MILLAWAEYRYQQDNIIPNHGHVLVTFRLAVIVHILVYASVIFITYIILRLFKASKETLKKALTLTTSVVFTLLIGEILIRTLGIASVYTERRGHYYISLFQQPYKGNPYHTHPANSTVTLRSPEFEYTRNTNSLGLRFPELPLKKDSGEIRIMALGDSFTDGDGAPQDSAWMNSLESELRKEYPDKNFTFINAGVCGSDVVNEYKLFKDKLAAYNPDILFVATNMSDIDDISLRGGFERFVTPDSCHYKNGPWWEKLYAISHIFRLAFLRNSNNLLISDSEYDKEVKKSTTIIKNTLEKFDTLTTSQNCQFVAVLMPVAIDFLNDRFFSLSTLTDSAGRHSFHTVNLYDCYTQKHGINKNNAFDYYWRIDGHQNSRGYKIFGECVADYVVSKQLLDSLPTIN